MPHERRKYARLKPQDGFLISCYSAEFSGRRSEQYNLAQRVLDVSRKGICVVTVGRVREGHPVMVELALPRAQAYFKARATVRWSQTVQSKDPRPKTAHVSGMEFDDEIPALGAPLSQPATPLSREPRRAHKRFVPQEVAILCIPDDVWKKLGMAKNSAQRVKDLSRGGAQIVASKKLKPGQRVDLRLEFHSPRAVVEAKGVVRWCRRDTLSVEPRWFAGVVFKNLTLDSEMNLRALEKIFLGARVSF